MGENTAYNEKIKARTSRMKTLMDLSRGDPEEAHGEADDILLEIAKENGYEELAEYFGIMEKWYA